MEYAYSPAADNNLFPDINGKGNTLRTTIYISIFGISFAFVVFLPLLIFLYERYGQPRPVAADGSPSTLSGPSSVRADRGGAPIQIVIQRDALPLCTFRRLKAAAASSGCNICLGDYKDGQAVRVLPECCHVFHRGCIDPCLRTHATCPTCRHLTPPAAAAASTL